MNRIEELELLTQIGELKSKISHLERLEFSINNLYESGGKIGIGTASPASILHVAGTSGPVLITGYGTPSNPGVPGLEIEYDQSGGYGDILSYDRNTSAYKPLQIRASAITLDNLAATILSIANNRVYTGYYFEALRQANELTDPKGYRAGSNYANWLQSYVNSSADAILSHNAYALYNNVYKYVSSHASFGFRMIRFGYGGAGKGIEFFTQQAATTADATISMPSPALVIENSGDIYSESLSNFFSSSTVTGWASYTASRILCTRLGKRVFVNFQIEGTSDNSSTSFTLPYSTGSEFYVRAPIQFVNASVSSTVPGMVEVSNSSNLAICKTDWVSGTWTASGTKRVRGQFWYQMA